MNIVITLPNYLIEAIVDGRKTIELRTKVPVHFNKDTDYVYVIEKGTKLVVARFQICEFVRMRNPSAIWMYYKHLLYVDFKWLNQYAKGKRYFCLWKISSSEYLSEKYHRGAFLGLSSNPQSFAYTQVYLK